MDTVPLLSLKDEIIEILRKGIFSGQLENGVELTQESIADQLKVSRIPVREALQQLEAEGLLERLPNRHVRVVGITITRLRQNFHMLAAIEAEIATHLVSGNNFAGIDKTFTQCRNAYDQRDWSLFREADLVFHLSLSSSLDNYTLCQLHNVQHRVLFSGIMDNLHPNWDKVIALDEEIWRAAHAGDRSELRRTIFEYYTVLAQDAIEELTQ